MIQTQESRPDFQSRTAITLAPQSIAPGFTVGGVVSIDLSRETDEHTAGRRIQAGAEAPPNADVIFTVALGQHVPVWAADYFRENGAHLRHVEVRSECGETIKTWCKALRGETN